MLNLVAEELPDPFYYVLDDISSVMHCETPNHSVFRYNFLNLIRLTPAHVINSLLFMSYVRDISQQESEFNGHSYFFNFQTEKICF